MDFRTFLRDRIVVSDGAFGTLLQQRTHGAGTLPERLNIEDPQAVASIHRAYLAAGADMISANTFGANERKTGSRGLSQKLVRAGIDLARREAGDKFVALDIGPIGQLLEPMGSLTFEEAYFGVEKQINVVRSEECPDCHGSGARDASSVHTCPYCHGTGYVTQRQQTLFDDAAIPGILIAQNNEP